LASIDLRLEGVGAFGDIPKDKLTDATRAGPIRVAGLQTGVFQKHSLVAIGLPLPNEGGMVFSQTSLEAFLNAADEMKKRFGDPRVSIVRGT
jgi:hypothetical protein